MPDKVKIHRPSGPPSPEAEAPDGAVAKSLLLDDGQDTANGIPSSSSVEKPAHKPPQFIFDPLAPYKGAVRRFFIAYRHVIGLLMGGAVAYARALPPERRRRLHSPGPRLLAFVLKPFVKRDLVNLPFPTQLRRRLEMLGPTFIKLGQVMAIREDLLPPSITDELQNLFDRLPAIPFAQIQAIIEDSLGQPVAALFDRIDPDPLGSASIAQAHYAETRAGDKVVIKVMKPGIKESVVADLKLLQAVGRFLQWIIPRYQPRQIIDEFCAYTLKEVDFTYEADHAEIFAANFQDLPDVVFPKIYRSLSTDEVLTMGFLDGFSPGASATYGLTDEQRKRIVDLGAASIIRMLYQDGFFHADLHAGNLKIMPTDDGIQIGFIDVGMVGRFEEKTRRRMLYYFHALVNGNVEGATRYLTDMAQVGPGGDPQGFRRAVADTVRRFTMHAGYGDVSIAQLILESVALGGKYRVFFPVEMTLMVKALVTYEGVGRLLDPHMDIAAVSRKHVARIFRDTFDPEVLTRRLMSNAPEMLDLLVQSPHLISSGFKFLEESLNNRSPSNPLAGLRSSILAGACIVGGVLALIQGGPVLVWVALFVIGALLAGFGK
ncbi:MAG TPA: AarF/UbiB family protein [Rhodothermales bacterium]|nr:AarF/UbiB family protein [Rhodothermales bacterium]